MFNYFYYCKHEYITSVSDVQFKNFKLKINYLNSSILTGNFTVKNCLSNFSNNGHCNKVNLTLICICDQYFEGPAFNIDTRPCSSHPCLNGAECIQNLTSLNFNCRCADLYEGKYCENRINLCKNQTCSGHGKYEEFDNKTTYCKCNNLYEGTTCDVQTEELKVIENVINWSVVIAIATIVALYLIVFILDVTNKNIRDSFSGQGQRSKKNIKPKKRAYKKKSCLERNLKNALVYRQKIILIWTLRILSFKKNLW